MEASVQCHTICFGENNLTTNCTEGWMGYTAILNNMKRKILAPARNSTILLRRLAYILVTILTTLHQLLKFILSILFYNEHFFINIMYKYRNITICIFLHHTFLLDTQDLTFCASPSKKLICNLWICLFFAHSFSTNNCTEIIKLLILVILLTYIPIT